MRRDPVNGQVAVDPNSGLEMEENSLDTDITRACVLLERLPFTPVPLSRKLLGQASDLTANRFKGGV